MKITGIALSVSLLFVTSLSFGIRGGTLAEPTEWPNSISLQWINRGTMVHPIKCSGTLIAPKLILTAAHCAYGLKTGSLISINRSFQPQSVANPNIEISRALIHPEYDPSPSKTTYYNDVAVLELFETLSESLQVSSFPMISKNPVVDGEQFVAVGSGLTSMSSQTLAKSPTTKKRYATMMSQGREKDIFILPSGNGVSACGGDSGGGVFRQNSDGTTTLVGVMMLVNGRCNGKTGYTAAHDITYSRDWIIQALGYGIGN